MIKKNSSSYSLEGDATFKQSWKVAHIFAAQLENDFPQYDHNQLARLINGSIYYYHKAKGQPMSKLEASDIISNQTSCPNYYIDHLKDFLDNLSKSKITKSSNQTEDKKEPDLHLLAAIASQGQGE